MKLKEIWENSRNKMGREFKMIETKVDNKYYCKMKTTIPQYKKDNIKTFLKKSFPYFIADCFGSDVLESEDDYIDNRITVSGYDGLKRRSFHLVLDKKGFVVLCYALVKIYDSLRY